MSTDNTEDRFQVIGEDPVPPTTDNVSSTPIGSDTVPAEDERSTHYPIGGGQPA